MQNTTALKYDERGMTGHRIYADYLRAAARGVSGLAMRWNEFAATLTPREHSRLVNALTAGWGYAHLAVRAAERNTAFALVRYRLGRARDLIDIARGILDPSVAVPPAIGGAAPRRARRPAWQDFLDRRSPADLERLKRAMADAVIDARLAADVLVENGHIEQASQRLDQSLHNLTLAWRLCDGEPPQQDAGE